MADTVSTFKAICKGGLNTGSDVLTLGENFTGAAIQLVNYEPNLEGGYRKINGFKHSYGTIAGSGSVLGITVSNGVNQGVLGCRTPSSGNNYLHHWNYYYSFTVNSDSNLTVGQILTERTTAATASTATGVSGTLISKDSNTIVVDFGKLPTSVFTNGKHISDDSFSTSTNITSVPAVIGWTAIVSNVVANDPDGVCATQTTGGAANLSINGALHDSNTINFTTSAAQQPRKVTIFSAGGDVSGINFVITGTNYLGTALEETLVGPAADATVTSVNYFNTISQIASSGAVTGNITVGSGAGFYRTSNPTMTGVDKVRFSEFNFNSSPKIVLTDGINQPAIYDGTHYRQILHSACPTDPKFSAVHAKRIWLAGDPQFDDILYHGAADDEHNFDTGEGGGFLAMGFPIVAIKPFRNSLYVFGINNIKRIVGNNGDECTAESVTTNLGCLASDSVVEIGGDLIFLSPDGIRPISGTNKIGDVNLETLSKNIQSTINGTLANEVLTTLSAVVIKKKSQFRYMFSASGSEGIIGGLRQVGDGYGFEFGTLSGLECVCAASGYLGQEEIVIHGDTAGKVYAQESGNSFDTSTILSIYKTPFVYMQDPEVRKNYYSISTYMKAEGVISLSLGVTYDYDDTETAKPRDLFIQNDEPASFFTSGINIATYGAENDTTGDIYDGNPSPVERSTFTGSGKSISFSYVTNDINSSHSIQGYTVTYGIGDVR
jgi:hypothetical protein